MTLNTCASMKLEVHFQRKQVSPGPEGNVRSWGAASKLSVITPGCARTAPGLLLSTAQRSLPCRGMRQRGVCRAVCVTPRAGAGRDPAAAHLHPALLLHHRLRGVGGPAPRPPAAGQNGRKAAARGIVPVSGSPSPQHKEVEGEGAGVCEAGAGRSCCSSSEAAGIGVGARGRVAAGCVAARFGLGWLTRPECFCWVCGHRATHRDTPAACHAGINTEPGPGSCSGVAQK